MNTEDLIEIKDVYEKLRFYIKNMDLSNPIEICEKMFNSIDGKILHTRKSKNTINISGEIQGYTIERLLMNDNIRHDLEILAEDLTMAYWRKQMNRKEYTTMDLIKAIQNI